MNWFKELSARVKLLLSFFAVSAGMACVACVALYMMSTINAAVTKMYEKEVLGIIACDQASMNLIRIGRALPNVVIEPEVSEKRIHAANLHEYKKDFLENLQQARRTTKSQEVLAICDRVESQFKDYDREIERTIEAGMKGDPKASLAAIRDARAVADNLGKEMRGLLALKTQFAEDGYKASNANYSNAFWLVVVCITIGTGLGLTLGYFIARWFTNALLEVDAIAGSLSTASAQLAAAADMLSSGAQEQASSLEETAASLEEITGTVQQNADNAQQANRLSSNSREVAERGGDVTKRAVVGMNEINDASKKIADIITTIDEIAFQTNLLALNAAVEAARAGEQGRGFAVVAGEVRNLAQRSAGAAKEIKVLIQDSVSKVQSGSDLVNQSGTTLVEIVGSVKQVTDLVAEIAAASREQAVGVEQVNRAVTQMDQITQSNASQTEELSSTAESLAAQARHLQTVVDQFHLTDNSARQRSFTVGSPAPRASATRTRSSSPMTKTATRPAARPAVHQEPEHEMELVGAGAGGFDNFEEF